MLTVIYLMIDFAAMLDTVDFDYFNSFIYSVKNAIIAYFDTVAFSFFPL